MEDNKGIRIVQTNDGSSTLEIESLKETYHSTHGAIQESMYVFIEQGLKHMNLPSLRILEVGFGTGLNALLTMLNGSSIEISYVGLETNPLPYSLVKEMQYHDQLHLKSEYVDFFKEMHTCGWKEEWEIRKGFVLRKLEQRVQAFEETDAFDLVFYDAFGPRSQSEMWELTALEPVVRSLRKGGVLVTYCAQGAFKRNLKALGMIVEELPGPPGKRQMTRASRA